VYFRHSKEIWREFPELVPGVLAVSGITPDTIAQSRLGMGPEGEFPEIRAWRRPFSRMGLRPTQYRCASESLRRCFRKDGSLAGIHPLIDLCNAVSLAFAIPVAAFDVSALTDFLEVRHASGAETYETFSGDVECPDPGEVIFCDASGFAHARRRSNRQSGRSAVRPRTASVVIVAEAPHDTAADDLGKLVAALSEELDIAWSAPGEPVILSTFSPRVDI
jgi:DNA/RNA-binding domain of Phe-tRNA-synthetase-like protein